MGKDSAVEWANYSHGFWYGCHKVSPGCRFCYAEREMTRFDREFNTVTRAKGFNKPLAWKEPGRVFVNPWSDFFIKAADGWRNEAWDIIRRTPHLTYLILTKRVANVLSRLPADWGEGWPNVWLGFSAENQKMYDKRLLDMLAVPATIRFVSVEPMLEAINLGLAGIVPRSVQSRYTPVAQMLNWVVVGGESGYEPRPLDPNWVNDILAQCEANAVPFFFKQWGGSPDNKRGGDQALIRGSLYQQFPDVEPYVPPQQLELL